MVYNPNKNWPEHSHLENGNYQNKCSKCGEFFIGHKRSPLCRECYYILNPNDGSIRYGYVALWEEGVNFGYSKLLEDITLAVMMVGLAGQDYMKVGIINNFKEFKELLHQKQSLPLNSENSNIDLEATFNVACSYLDSFTTQDFHDCYITPDSILRLYNNSEIKETC